MGNCEFVTHRMTGSKAACALSGAGDVASDRSHVTQPTSEPEDNSGTRLDPRVHTPSMDPIHPPHRCSHIPDCPSSRIGNRARLPHDAQRPPVRRPRARSERPAPPPQAHAVPANQIEIPPPSNRIPKHAPDQLIIGASARARIAIRRGNQILPKGNHALLAAGSLIARFRH